MRAGPGRLLDTCTIRYWEAWKVANGQIDPRYVKPHDNFEFPNNAGIRTIEPFCTWGEAEIRGFARFVSLDELPLDKATLPRWYGGRGQGIVRGTSIGCEALNSFFMNAGDLKHTNKKDDAKEIWQPVWEIADPPEVVQHNLITNWWCCPCNGIQGCPENKSHIYPGIIQ